MQELEVIEIENRAWRGIRAYPKREFVRKSEGGEKRSFEIQEGWDGYYLTLYWYKPESFRHSDGTVTTREGCYGGHEGKFATFADVLKYLQDEYALRCTYPAFTKELFGDWTWEQNIAYGDASVDTKNSWDDHVRLQISTPHEPFARMVAGLKVRVIEAEMLELIRDRAGITNDKLDVHFPGEATEEGMLSRLAHDYGNGRSPQVTRRHYGWYITAHGLQTLKTYYDALAEKGYYDNSPY